jgi:hypothetical protein
MPHYENLSRLNLGKTSSILDTQLVHSRSIYIGKSYRVR